MGVLERIADIEKEMSRTQKNKATVSHLWKLKAQLAKLRSEHLDTKGPRRSRARALRCRARAARASR
jgi:ribosome-interacting GTPase 1